MNEKHIWRKSQFAGFEYLKLFYLHSKLGRVLFVLILKPSRLKPNYGMLYRKKMQTYDGDIQAFIHCDLYVELKDIFLWERGRQKYT